VDLLIATLAILLVSIPCTWLLGIVPALHDLQERDSVFFFEACEATFFVAMASLKEMSFGLKSLDFGKKR